MTDITLNAYLARGTQATRLALVPNPGPGLGVYFYETDTKRLWAWDATVWKCVSGPTVIVDATTSRALAVSDSQNYIRMTAATAIAVSVPTQAHVPWGENTTVAIEQAGAGEVTITGEVGVTINIAASFVNKSAERYSVMQLIRVGLNEWTLTGALKFA